MPESKNTISVTTPKEILFDIIEKSRN